MSHSDRFIALNVGSGDAFYLERRDERGEFSCLVDGGRRKNFVDRFRKVTKRQQVEVEVVVCTHNDSDHVDGLIDFFKNGGKAKECWLPATWMQPLQMMLKDPDLAFKQLCFADYSEQIPETEDRRDDKEISAEWLNMELKKRVDSQHFDEFYPFFPIVVVFISERSDEDVPIEAEDIPVIETATIRADNILCLATAATRRGAEIRWFYPDEKPQPIEEAHPNLHLINASEVPVIPTISRAFPDLLYLTVKNAYSLVLYSPAGDGPDVLFSADSGFGSPRRQRPPVFHPPVGKNMLVTAPHHGSKDCENEEAYHRLKDSDSSNFQTLTWVRSGLYQEGKLPGKKYLDQHRRFCTNCRGCSGDGQDVVMIGSNGCWKPEKGVSPCCCSNP